MSTRILVLFVVAWSSEGKAKGGEHSTDKITWGQNISFVQTLVWVFDFRSRRVAANGRRTASDSREAEFGGRSADRQQRRKKKAFDRGGPVRPPRSNAKDDHSG